MYVAQKIYYIIFYVETAYNINLSHLAKREMDFATIVKVYIRLLITDMHSSYSINN